MKYSVFSVSSFLRQKYQLQPLQHGPTFELLQSVLGPKGNVNESPE